MPIKPENRARYPADWTAIRDQVLARARYRCEWPCCKARHHQVGRWVLAPTMHVFEGAKGSRQLDLGGRAQLPFAQARALVEADLTGELLVIVLTIAHLDHVPEHCAPENLRAWCQRHHLAYDKDHHAETQYMARRERAMTLELPL